MTYLFTNIFLNTQRWFYLSYKANFKSIFRKIIEGQYSTASQPNIKVGLLSTVETTQDISNFFNKILDKKFHFIYRNEIFLAWNKKVLIEESTGLDYYKSLKQLRPKSMRKGHDLLMKQFRINNFDLNFLFSSSHWPHSNMKRERYKTAQILCEKISEIEQMLCDKYIIEIYADTNLISLQEVDKVNKLFSKDVRLKEISNALKKTYDLKRLENNDFLHFLLKFFCGYLGLFSKTLISNRALDKVYFKQKCSTFVTKVECIMEPAVSDHGILLVHHYLM